MKKNILFVLLFVVVILSSQLFAQDNTYLTPYRLFHIERSKNQNLVCYDINLKDGKPDEKNPLIIYWVDREESPGEKKELNTLQKRLAYGYKLFPMQEDSFDITLSAYPGRNLTIQQQDGKYVCIIKINNQSAVLHSLYVKAKASNSLSVEYVELRGTSLDSKAFVTERVGNK